MCIKLVLFEGPKAMFELVVWAEVEWSPKKYNRIPLFRSINLKWTGVINKRINSILFHQNPHFLFLPIWGI